MAAQMQVQTDRSSILRPTLQANMTFSSVSGTLMIAAANPIATFMGLDAPLVFVIVGGVTILFAGYVFWTLRQPTLNRPLALSIFVLDTLWVLASAVLLLTNVLPLTREGKWGILIIADIVAVFAALEFYALRQLR